MMIFSSKSSTKRSREGTVHHTQHPPKQHGTTGIITRPSSDPQTQKHCCRHISATVKLLLEVMIYQLESIDVSSASFTSLHPTLRTCRLSVMDADYMRSLPDWHVALFLHSLGSEPRRRGNKGGRAANTRVGFKRTREGVVCGDERGSNHKSAANSPTKSYTARSFWRRTERRLAMDGCFSWTIGMIHGVL